jgi:hypothetical protein
MLWLILIFGVIGAWAMLTVLGGERETRLQSLTARVINARRNDNSPH